MTTSALHSLIFTVAFAIGTVLGTCAANPSSVAGPAKLVPGVASALVKLAPAATPMAVGGFNRVVVRGMLGRAAE